MESEATSAKKNIKVIKFNLFYSDCTEQDNTIHVYYSETLQILPRYDDYKLREHQEAGADLGGGLWGLKPPLSLLGFT